MKRVVVSGLGVVCGLGFHWEPFWKKLINGESSIERWRMDGEDDFPVKYASSVDLDALYKAFADEGVLGGSMERRSRFGVAAARAALRDAGIKEGEGGLGRLGVLVGSGVAEQDRDDLFQAMGTDGPSWENYFKNIEKLNPDTGNFHTNDSLAAAIARQNNCSGPVVNFSSACAGATQALGQGFRMVRRGETPWVLAGGCDSVLNFRTMIGLYLLGATSTTEKFGAGLCRPFDRDRSGLVAGEGAGMLLLEEHEHALERGAKIYAEFKGFGASLDAYRVTAPRPDGSGAALAMERALADAGLYPEEVDHINAHGTSTPLNDPIESLAIKSVFESNGHYRNLTVTSNKASFGHLIAAAGAPEAISAVLAVKEDLVPPTLNLENPEDGCDLDYVPKTSKRQKIRNALSNSFGFGGLNSCLAVGKYHG